MNYKTRQPIRANKNYKVGSFNPQKTTNLQLAPKCCMCWHASILPQMDVSCLCIRHVPWEWYMESSLLWRSKAIVGHGKMTFKDHNMFIMQSILDGYFLKYFSSIVINNNHQQYTNHWSLNLDWGAVVFAYTQTKMHVDLFLTPRKRRIFFFIMQHFQPAYIIWIKSINAHQDSSLSALKQCLGCFHCFYFQQCEISVLNIAAVLGS